MSRKIEWTPEPWFAVEDPPYELRRMVRGDDTEVPLTVANLARAAACVNACQGIPTDALVAWGQTMDCLDKHIQIAQDIEGYVVKLWVGEDGVFQATPYRRCTDAD